MMRVSGTEKKQSRRLGRAVGTEWRNAPLTAAQSRESALCCRISLTEFSEADALDSNE